MMPVFRYPQYGNQMASAPNCQTNFEACQPVMMVDPSKSFAVSQPCLHSNNFGYSAPFYPCCNHANSPGFYGYAPCPHFSSPQLYCYAQPPVPNSVPVHYVPSPQYMKELPRYEYDKPNESGFHCCGCPNHTHNQSNGASLKVEELPDVEKMASDSSLPGELRNSKYPILWIPNEYLKNKESRRPIESDRAGREKPSRDLKLSKNMKPFEESNGWFPLDMKTVQSLMHGGDGTRMHDLQSNDETRQFPMDMKKLRSLMQGDDEKSVQGWQADNKMRQFPFPTIWMPPYNVQGKAEEQHQDGNAVSDSVKGSVRTDIGKLQVVHENSAGHVPQLEESNSNQRSIPVKQMEAPKEDNAKHVERREKSIPVKQIEAPEEKNSEQCKRREKIIPVKQMEAPSENSSKHVDGREKSPSRRAEDNGTGKPSDTIVKKEASSSPKTSKLPPVCLRVDPLPKRKNGNKSSRSPSPPGQSHDAPEASVSSDLKAKNRWELQVQNDSLGSKEGATRERAEGAELKTIETKGEENKSCSQTPISVSPSNDPGEQVFCYQTTENTIKNDIKTMVKEDNGSRNVDELTGKQVNEGKETRERSFEREAKAEKKALSDNEAALHIQSAYRGFEVRKWEPLKKLKQIGFVQEKLAEVEKKIHELESSIDLQKDERQRALIGEMIMSLLLKLDTVQGLHSSLRDIRKSLARELVSLQEKLDLLAQIRPSENLSSGRECSGATEEERGQHPSHGMIDSLQDVLADETSNLPLCKEELKESETRGQSELPESNEFVPLDPISVTKSEEIQQGTGDQKPPASSGEDGQSGTTIVMPGESKVGESNNLMSSGAVGNTLNASALLAENDAFEELPVGVTDDEEPEKLEQCMKSESNKLLSSAAAANNTLNASEQLLENDALEELAVGVIDDEKHEKQEQCIEVESNDSHSSAVAMNASNASKLVEMDVFKELPVLVDDEEPDKQDHDGMKKNEALPGEDVECEVTTIVPDQQPMEPDLVMSNESPSELEAVELSNEPPQTNAALLDKDMTIQSELPIEDVPGEVVEADVSHGQAISGENVERTHVLEVSNDNEPEYGSQPEQSGSDEVLLKDIDQGQKHYGVVVDQPHMVETSERQSEAGSELTKHDEKGEEAAPVSSVNSQLSEQEMKNDRKLVEENEKMREMVEKLMAAGKEQMDVIHNLTGRIKDLEKRLARRKKLRAGRYRRPCARPSSKCASNTAVDVVM